MKAKQPRQMAALRWLALLLTAALMTTVAACGKDKEDDPTTTQPPVTGEYSDVSNTAAGAGDIPAWSLEVRGVPTVTRFTSVDAQYLPKVEVSLTMQNEFGVSATRKYGGVTLRSILNQFYVPNVVSVAVTSMSGATATYPQDLAMHQDTVLAWEIDGVPIDTQHPLRMCPGAGGGTEMFVESVAAINVSPLDPSMTTTTLPTYGQIVDINGNPIPTISPTYPPYNPNANTYTMPPPIYNTTVSTAPPTTTRAPFVFTTKTGYNYVGPNTAAYTMPPTATPTTQTNPPTTAYSYDPFRPGGSPTTTAPTAPTAPSTAPTTAPTAAPTT